MMKMKLSIYFSLWEFTRSATAERLGISNELHMPEDEWIIENLETLCKSVLDPVRRFLGRPVSVTSGFRCPRLNEEVGGVSTSQHKYGKAADINFHGFSEDWLKLAWWAMTNDHIPIDQFIVYDTFIHISWASHPRHQFIDKRKSK